MFYLLLLLIPLIQFNAVALVSANEIEKNQVALLQLEPVSADHQSGDSKPLTPREYFPLGMGIRKDDDHLLVPFCIAKNPELNSCTWIQYFEIVVGQYRDSDRVIDTQYGVPTDRVTGKEESYHGTPVGYPFTGYVFSGLGIKEAYQEFLSAKSRPDVPGYWDVFDSDEGTITNIDFMGEIGVGMLGLGAVGGLIGHLQPGGTYNDGLYGFVIGASVGVATPFVRAAIVHSKYGRKSRRFKRDQKFRAKSIPNSFEQSKRIQENWTILGGVPVSDRAYDAFVDFLKVDHSNASSR